MKRKWSSLTVLLLMAALVLSGCTSSMKVAKAATKFGKAMLEQPVTGATAEISTGLRSDSFGIPADLRLRTVVHSAYDLEDGRAFSDIDSSISLQGVDIHQSGQCYSSLTRGEFTSYMHLDNPDLWCRLDHIPSLTALDRTLVLELMETVSEDAVLELRESGAGGEYYTLSACFDGEDVLSFLRNTDALPENVLGNLSATGVRIPVEVDLEEKTFLPLRMQINVEGISGELSRKLSGLLSHYPELQDLDFEMGDISILITNFTYGEKTVAKLPMGAAENALDLGKLQALSK